MKRRKTDNGSISNFYCTCCGNKGIPIFRYNGSFREAGHLKKLFCIYCGETKNHVEIRPIGSYTYENFLEEFELGRFLEDGTRIPVAELLSCSKIDCNYNRDGRCWNSNNSYKDCKHKPQEV